MKNISIIIPSYNEEIIIGTCLESIVNSIDYISGIYPINFDIILSDCSTDNTKNIARQYRYTTVLGIEKKGIAIARAEGTLYAINNMDADIIISTDADIIVPFDWLYKICTHLNNNDELVAVTGKYIDSANRFYESISINIANYMFIGLGGNTAFKSKSYLQIGGYNIKMANYEDIDLWNRFKLLGKTLFDKDIYVFHDSDYRWRGASAYLLSGLSLIAGNFIPYLGFLKPVGLTISGYELIKNGDKLKNFAYNKPNEPKR